MYACIYMLVQQITVSDMSKHLNRNIGLLHSAAPLNILILQNPTNSNLFLCSKRKVYFYTDRTSNQITWQDNGWDLKSKHWVHRQSIWLLQHQVTAYKLVWKIYYRVKWNSNPAKDKCRVVPLVVNNGYHTEHTHLDQVVEEGQILIYNGANMVATPS